MARSSKQLRTIDINRRCSIGTVKGFIAKSEFIRTHTGRFLAFLNGFTYCKHYKLKLGARRWQCSMHASKSCAAHLIISDDGSIRRKNELHSHPPSKFFRNKDGSYIRL